MSESILRIKSKEYAIDSIFLVRKLKERRVETPLINQFLRSATSVGANIHEGNMLKEQKILFLNLK